jgi:rusticyanin
MPVDAKAVASNDTVWIAPGSPHLLILISPPGADDEFVIAGLVDPTIFVPHGVTLYVSVANLDTEDTHSWGITDHGPPFGNMPMMGSGSGPSWWGSSMMGLAGGGRYWSQDLSLTLVLPGTYWYVCLHPGHAADGMYGNLVVE